MILVIIHGLKEDAIGATPCHSGAAIVRVIFPPPYVSVQPIYFESIARHRLLCRD
jgi:hypothetical protein